MDLLLDFLHWWLLAYSLPSLNANKLVHPRWLFTVSAGDNKFHWVLFARPTISVLNSHGWKICLPIFFPTNDKLNCLSYFLYLGIYLMGCAFSSKSGFIGIEKKIIFPHSQRILWVWVFSQVSDTADTYDQVRVTAHCRLLFHINPRAYSLVDRTEQICTITGKALEPASSDRTCVSN